MRYGEDSLRDALFYYIFENNNSMFQAKWNTDLTIRCQGKEFHVHKIIVGMQSAFFEKACDPESPFKEARTGVITLTDDDAFLVRILLVYCYTGDLDRECMEEWCRENDMDGDTWEYIALCTVRIYGLADKFQILSLKKVAQQLFKEYMEHEEWARSDLDFFPDLVREVYRTTPCTDRGLRDLVLYFTSKELHYLIQTKRFRVKMEKIQGFWGELHIYQAETGKRERICPNSECKVISSQSFPNWTVRYNHWFAANSLTCPKCKSLFGMREWNKPLDDDDEKGSYKDSSDDESPSSSNKRKRLEETPELGMSPPAAKTRRLQVCDGI
ncbi:uncharacterized protein J3D65DRAFT_695683 [Phyllosticta citribraziliensis]|uniref:BTB domain-containing protein n=1 Tax=Phyllosticta citribraziliensis TaxID=989973 RepID=A0ABR1LS87_9PEZI